MARFGLGKMFGRSAEKGIVDYARFAGFKSGAATARSARGAERAIEQSARKAGERAVKSPFSKQALSSMLTGGTVNAGSAMGRPFAGRGLNLSSNAIYNTGRTFNSGAGAAVKSQAASKVVMQQAARGKRMSKAVLAAGAGLGIVGAYRGRTGPAADKGRGARQTGPYMY